MAAMITAGVQQQGRNAIHKHLHPANEPETVTEDETSIIQKLLDESSKQAEEDHKNGIWHTTEDAWISLEKHMGWDADFYQAHDWSRDARKKLDAIFAEMRIREGWSDENTMER